MAKVFFVEELRHRITAIDAVHGHPAGVLFIDIARRSAVLDQECRMPRTGERLVTVWICAALPFEPLGIADRETAHALVLFENLAGVVILKPPPQFVEGFGIPAQASSGVYAIVRAEIQGTNSTSDTVLRCFTPSMLASGDAFVYSSFVPPRCKGRFTGLPHHVLYSRFLGLIRVGNLFSDETHPPERPELFDLGALNCFVRQRVCSDGCYNGAPKFGHLRGNGFTRGKFVQTLP